MRRSLFLAGLLAACVCAEDASPTGNRTTPPTINVIAPRGVARGTTVELTVEGLNLANAQAILFDQPGVKGRVLRVKELPDLPDIRLGSNGTQSTVDLGPLPPRNQVTVELDIDADANVGPVGFRLQTPLGTSPEGRILIEPFWARVRIKSRTIPLTPPLKRFSRQFFRATLASPGMSITSKSK